MWDIRHRWPGLVPLFAPIRTFPASLPSPLPVSLEYAERNFCSFHEERIKVDYLTDNCIRQIRKAIFGTHRFDALTKVAVRTIPLQIDGTSNVLLTYQQQHVHIPAK